MRAERRKQSKSRALKQSRKSSHQTKQTVAKMLKVAQRELAGVANEDVMAAGEGYGKRLQRLRVRSGVSVQELTEALGAKSPTTYRNYENEKRYNVDEPDKPILLIPAPLIMAVAPIMVGKGEPPITLDELLEISEMRGARRLLALDAGRPSALVPREVPETVPFSFPFLCLRYRLERGVFREQIKMQDSSFGTAPILPMRTYPQNRQWAAQVDDDHGGRYGIPKGSIVACVDYEALPPGSVPVGTVVVLRRTRDSLNELRLASVASGHNEFKADDQNLSGAALGVALYSYAPISQQTA